ncbi:hypothetical protein VIGAN_07222100, partial [Vigna angularis var. angularis]
HTLLSYSSCSHSPFPFSFLLPCFLFRFVWFPNQVGASISFSSVASIRELRKEYYVWWRKSEGEKGSEQGKRGFRAGLGLIVKPI